MIRTLGPGDEEALQRFLLRHADSSLFLRSNSRRAGLVDQGRPFEATYVAAEEADEIVGVAALCWNGILLVQAPAHLDEVVRGAARSGVRTVNGIGGRWAQVVAARGLLGFDDRPAAMVHQADLFSLELGRLRVPPALASGAVLCRSPRHDENDLLVAWRVAYAVETLGQTDGPELRATSERELEELASTGDLFVLEEGGVPVAFSAFNSRVPDTVQVGGVYTPPALRGRGHARSVVAGSLLSARGEGVTRSVLFTEVENVPARRAYLSLGYEVTGDYGLVLFRDDRAASH